MHCLFCKQNSESSKSVEHIIPESLGNKIHILPKGIVCDSCNQYFATKIEQPLLEQPYFKNVRHRAQIESKKGRIPIEKGIFLSDPFNSAEIKTEKNGDISLILNEKESTEILLSKDEMAFTVPHLITPEKNNKTLSRFLSKVAVEVLLYCNVKKSGWIEEITNDPNLDDIKNYTRYGKGFDFWQYSERRVYSEDTRFNHPEIAIKNYEVLHEFSILETKENEYYFVIAIMGIEYVICYSNPKIDGYMTWLELNNNKSIFENIQRTQNIPKD